MVQAEQRESASGDLSKYLIAFSGVVKAALGQPLVRSLLLMLVAIAVLAYQAVAFGSAAANVATCVLLVCYVLEHMALLLKKLGSS